MLSKKNTVWLCVGALGLILAGWAFWDVLNYVSTDNAQVAGHSVLLSQKVSGIVEKVFIVEGQKVKRGDPLVQIDKRDFQNSLETYQGLVDSFTAQKVNAAKNLVRERDLLTKNVATQQQYDDANSTLEDVVGKLKATNAQATQAILNLNNTLIVAPADGFIARRSVEVGQYASTGIPLIGFIDSSERWIEANIKETDLKGVRAGSPVEIRVDALGGKLYQGVVENVTAATGATFTLLPPDNASGNFTKVVQLVPVKIAIKNLTEEDIEKLQVGISVEVKIKKSR